MGIGTIIQKNISKSCQSLWKSVPSIPQISIDLSKYNKSVVNFVALVGLYTLYKTSKSLTAQSIKLIKGTPKIPTVLQLQQKYGQHSWVLIVDCKGNQQYCILMAKKGFNLIICGQQQDIQIATSRISTQVNFSQSQQNYKLQTRIINWQQPSVTKSITTYQQLLNDLNDFDISIIIMPRIQKDIKSYTFQQKIPVFEHVYLIARYFGNKLKWRATSSAIIIPSILQVDQIDEMNGVTRAVCSGVDSFGRTLGFQLKGMVEVICARGNPENALRYLGKQNVSY